MDHSGYTNIALNAFLEDEQLPKPGIKFSNPYDFLERTSGLITGPAATLLIVGIAILEIVIIALKGIYQLIAQVKKEESDLTLSDVCLSIPIFLIATVLNLFNFVDVGVGLALTVADAVSAPSMSR